MTTMTTKDSKKQKTQQIKKEATKRITYILDRLGVRFSRKGDLIQGTCPAHQHEGDGNNPTAFSWRLDIGRWVCWTHHCQELYANDVFGLVQSVLEMPFKEAVAWVEDVLDSDEARDAIDIDEVNSRPRKSGAIHQHKPLTDNLVKMLKPSNPPQELIDEGFDPQVLMEYEVGRWDRLGTFMHDRIVFPVRDQAGKLVGFTGRTIYDDYRERSIKSKWLHGRRFDKFPRPNDFQTGSILYNLHVAKEYLGTERAIIIVEGPKDVLKLVQAGIYNVVATLGTAFGPAHRTLLVQLGVNVIYRAYDPDKAGHKGEQLMEEVVGDLIEIRDIDLPEGQDPGSMTNEQNREVFACTSAL